MVKFDHTTIDDVPNEYEHKIYGNAYYKCMALAGTNKLRKANPGIVLA